MSLREFLKKFVSDFVVVRVLDSKEVEREYFYSYAKDLIACGYIAIMDWEVFSTSAKGDALVITISK